MHLSVLKSAAIIVARSTAIILKAYNFTWKKPRPKDKRNLASSRRPPAFAKLDCAPIICSLVTGLCKQIDSTDTTFPLSGVKIRTVTKNEILNQSCLYDGYRPAVHNHVCKAHDH